MATKDQHTDESGGSSPSTSRWSVQSHDTIPSTDFAVLPQEGHAYLSAFLNSEGAIFKPPYSAVRSQVEDVIQDHKDNTKRRQAPSSDVTDQRFRTWKKTFESLGFLWVDGVSSEVRLTPLGRTIKAIYGDLNLRIEGANDRLAEVAVRTLERHFLLNPVESDAGYPSDSDLRVYRFIWYAFRHLDNKLHWEEMSRVIMRVFYERDSEEAVAKIRAARKASSGRMTQEALSLLGSPSVQDGDETKRRITPWFTRAGFGDLLITSEDDEDGFRHLTDKYVPLLDEAIQRDIAVPLNARASKEAYLRYIGAEPELKAISQSPADEEIIAQALAAVRRYGSTKIVALAGIPGTGKTHLAKQVAAALTEGDPYRFAEIQFHEGTTYDDFMEGYVPRLDGDGFELRPKTLLVLNARAQKDPGRATYVLLIEEFTRANVNAVLGEVLTYVEHRDRPFRLSLSQREEHIADNLVILATMNPRDKSAAVLDQAVRRRLHVVRVDPSVERLHALLDGKLSDGVLERLVAWFQRFLPVLPFGHAEFSRVSSEQDIRDLWEGTLRYFLLDALGEVRDLYKDLESEFPWRG